MQGCGSRFQNEKKNFKLIITAGDALLTENTDTIPN